MAVTGTKKSHRDRKNPRAAELWRERKKQANAARGKQTWTAEHGYTHAPK